MAKRFVDTTLYDKAWFRKLPPRIKCLWEYIRLKCDAAGVIDFDAELASFQIGETVTWNDLEFLGDQISILEGTKIVLTGFIQFQFGKLSDSCKPHKPIIELVKKYNLEQRVLKGFQKGINTLEEKEQEQEQEKETEKEKEKERDDKITPSNVIQLWDDNVAEVGSVKKFPAYVLPQKALESFLITSGFPEFRLVDQWINYFKRIASCESVILGDWCVDLPWAVIHDNAIKVLSGKYDKSFKKKNKANEVLDSAIENMKANPFRNEEGAA